MSVYVSIQPSAVSRQPSAYFIQKLFGVASPQANGHSSSALADS
ncbi:hypothetical protein [Moorena sp. SIOASIH]|nr:hypothetical protein [Moorena sp. SIOASIH]